MPYKSQAQERYFNANRSKLEKQGVNVDEWNYSSKGKKLPKHADKAKTKADRKRLEKGTALRLKRTFPSLPQSQNSGQTRSGLEGSDKRFKVKGT